MKVDGTHYRSLWYDHDEAVLKIIDQRWLPHKFVVQAVPTLEDYAAAIKEMRVRGAPLIGATAAYGVAHQMGKDASDASLDHARDVLIQTRPTAINLKWALDRCQAHLAPLAPSDRATAALQLAHDISDEDVEINRMIGVHGLDLIRKIAADKADGEPVRILTHCNAGWIATVDWGTATSPMYQAHDAGIPVHIWVGETRPRNQGVLTAWELGHHGVPHTYLTDNAGGHLMQHGQVDMVLVGVDRATRQGDICNKIGTYLKALAAHDNDIPFYAALPSPTIDWTVRDGIAEIPIEERDHRETTHIWGRNDEGNVEQVQVSPDGTPAGNPAFDVTPARLVTGLITERGIAKANEEDMLRLFSEHREAV
ncbi:S-methyl-5-thioribose-1-phosphate isomerase [Hoeflea prorocentri]|uniref:Methylthioribose-1-phosphate isomerase n=1 Tax=Hoeflea prorocentri TaxID=1922333 RepID=A0A9X3UQN5_9HYPH|nr:S-methyl-5-thioribose-1-phosphate isomerase [Hoeflea prorocentri]MCY6383599.1 S-methyl-5-thioribose-1-phosphate isomerase [Hoeflea prorocentri]MDA5401399.1 S-methyl-5-thioribose-1-phosphate isomerase [Hoeflea prorocentri]